MNLLEIIWINSKVRWFFKTVNIFDLFVVCLVIIFIGGLLHSKLINKKCPECAPCPECANLIEKEKILNEKTKLLEEKIISVTKLEEEKTKDILLKLYKGLAR